jgi:hypothetical protein
MLRKLILAGFLALLAFPATHSYAQPVKIVATCGSVSPAFATTTPSNVLTMDVNGNLCTSASVSASISGFPTSQSTGTPISVTTGGVTGTLPAGAVVVATNVGTTNATYCKLGASATTSDQYIAPNGGWFAFTVGAATQLTCITSTSTTTVNMVGGSGLPTGTGGGGGSGGGSSAITTWAGGTLGAMANYGTSPGAVLVPGVNAFVTNTLAAVGNNADDVTAAAGAASPVANYNYLFDGTNWDRQRSAGGTGFAGVNPGTSANWGIGATGAAVPANGLLLGFSSGGNLTAPSSSAPLPTRPGDGTRQVVIDACEANAQSYATGVITTATTTRIIAPSASNKTYLCAFFMKASAADNVAVVEGTGGTCGTGTAALLGGTTTANGFVFGTAGDGVLLQAGGKVAIVQTAGTNVDTCLITSTTGPLIWSAKYVQAP